MSSYVVGLDLGQSRDFSALCVVERTGEGIAPRTEEHYAVRHLERWPLGVLYPQIVAEVLALLDTPPLSRSVPLVVDQTGVGRAVCDLFRTGGVRPHGCTITGGDEANREDPYNLKVPKRQLVSTMVACFQTGRLKIAEGLDLAPALIRELSTMRVKVNLATGNDAYEHWRASDHDDIALAVGIAVWYAESGVGSLPFGWLRNDPAFVARVLGQQSAPVPQETDEERIVRRLAARGWPAPEAPDSERPQRYGAPTPNPWPPERRG
jgi:hypothetical protein